MAALEGIPDLDVRLKSIVLQADAAKKKLDAKADGNAENAAKVQIMMFLKQDGMLIIEKIAELFDIAKQWDAVAASISPLVYPCRIARDKTSTP